MAAKKQTKSEQPERRKTHEVNPSQVRVGHLMAVLHYVRVDKVEVGGHNLRVTDLDTGVDFSVLGGKLVSSARSADLFEEEVEVTKTRCAEILITLHNVPFTVCFDKLDGTERILRGRLIAPEPLLGRSHVEDLMLPEDDKSRIRLVDHRTLKWLVVEGVKYVVK